MGEDISTNETSYGSDVVRLMLSVLPQKTKDKLASGTPKIISIGYGPGEEIVGLKKVFPQSEILGIEMVEEFPDLVRTYLRNSKGVHLVRADASDPNSFKNGGEVFTADLAVIRHPDLHRERDQWKKILVNTIEHLNKGGVMYITAYDRSEKDALLAMIKEIESEKGKLFVEELDTRMDALVLQMKNKDGYVVMVSKESLQIDSL